MRRIGRGGLAFTDLRLLNDACIILSTLYRIQDGARHVLLSIIINREGERIELKRAKIDWELMLEREDRQLQKKDKKPSVFGYELW